jgi:hypothetical protein
MLSGKRPFARALWLSLLGFLGSGCLTATASAGTYSVSSCAGNPAPVFGAAQPTGVGLGVSNTCSTGGLLAIAANAFPASNGGSGPFQQATAGWAAVTPSPALRIIFVNSDGLADCNLGSDGWGASYFWGDNGTNYGTSPVSVDCHGIPGNGSAGYINQSIESSRYVGFHASCNGSCTAAGAGNLVFGVSGITLEIEEDSGPSLAPAEANDLYNQTGWVQGTFPAGFTASDPSGICALQTQVNGAVINSYGDPTPDTTNWSQCPGGTLPGSVDTTKYLDGSGAISLQYAAANAAGVVSTVTRSINVDNAPVSVALTGPTDAPSTAGTQYITATATAGASGVRGISCSLDGGAAQWNAGSSTQIPVTGLGEHALTCRGENNSYNASGQAKWSAPATFQMRIGDPTVSGISFSKIVDTLRCEKVKERVKLRSRWVTIHRHHKLVRIHRRAHRKTIKVVKCHPRTIKRTVVVLVKERRHGRVVVVKRKKIERVVVAPHLLSKSTERVRHGKGITVNGWLGTTSGVALPGRTVDVMTAPDNGLGQWTEAAAVTTAADGAWSAALPAGPSRLVEAAYEGDTDTLASASTTIHLTVPARIRIHISPRSSPWGGTIRISGRVLGGYVPSGKLLRLRIGVAGVRGTVGIPSVRGDGRFRTRWTFSSGHGVVRYWFSVSTLSEADYPYAPASSRRVYVTVGPG